MVAVLAIAAAAAGPVRGQDANVSWVLTPYSNLHDGDTVVIVDKNSERALPYNYGTSDAPSAVAIEMSGDQNALTEEPAATLQWVVVLNNGNYQFKVPGSSIYLYCEDANNGVRVGDNGANQFTFWTGGPNDATFLKNTSNSRYIGVYVNSGTPQDWRCYTSTSINIGNTVTGFYKKTTSSAAVPPTPHTVRFASGNDGWTVTDVDSARSATAPAVLQNVMAGDSLVVTAPATLPGKVKSVKAVKYVPPAATVTTAPTATAAIIEAGSTTALVNAGAANGGTMMYAVTTTNVQPASTADFSDAIPTAQGRTAGTYYVWYYAKADDSHTDSEISATAVAVTVNGIVWTSSDMTSNFYANFNDGWTNNNTHQGITVTASGTAQGGWAQNSIDVNMGSGTITFTSSVGNIKSIVITADNMNNINEMNVPTGWTANAMMNNPRTLSWSGTATATVNLPLSSGQNISNISTIVFTLE